MYQIIIKKIEIKAVTHNDWNQIADTGNERDGGRVYGYVPNTTVKEGETEILRATVEEININEVIKSIYKI